MLSALIALPGCPNTREDCDRPDIVGDGVDQNCDGVDGVDRDGDGHASQESGGADCDDADPAIHPGVDEDGWTVETIPGDGASPSRCFAIAVDGNGTAHVAYVAIPVAEESPALEYANDASGTWELEEVFVTPLDAWGAEISAVHIAIDGDDGVHILDSVATGQFRDASAGLWSKVDPGWAQEWSANGGSQLAMASGPSGVLHLLYALPEFNAETSWPALYAATNETGEWVSELRRGARDRGREGARRLRRH